jgi:hypothetical protein
MSKITMLELPKSPSKYVLSKAYLSEDGYLMIAVKNQANIAVTAVTLKLDKMVNGYPVGATANFTLPGALEPGQQQAIKTTFGPFKTADEAGQYRTEVIAAQAVGSLNQ